MMNLQQRLAEIERRKQALIRQRRKRNMGILLGCIPLALCVGVCAVLTLSDRMPAAPEQGELMEAAPEQMEVANVPTRPPEQVYGAMQLDRICVTDALGQTQTLEGEQAQSVMAYLTTVAAELDDIHYSVSGSFQESDGGLEQTVKDADHWELTVWTASGEQTVYRLKGSILTYDGGAVLLTEEKLNTLTSMLGTDREVEKP